MIKQLLRQFVKGPDNDELDGYARPHDPADYERTVQTLLKGGSDPVITKEPEGAWTDKVSKMAM